MALVRGGPASHDHHCLYRDEFSAIGRLRSRSGCVPLLGRGKRMALITCEDCGKSISDRAPSCPHCGAPSATVPPPLNPLPIPQPTAAAIALTKGDKKSSFGNKVIFAILAIIALIIIIGHSGGTTRDGSTAAVQAVATKTPSPQTPTTAVTAASPAEPAVEDLSAITLRSAHAFCAGLKATGLLTEECKVSVWHQTIPARFFRSECSTRNRLQRSATVLASRPASISAIGSSPRSIRFFSSLASSRAAFVFQSGNCPIV